MGISAEDSRNDEAAFDDPLAQLAAAAADADGSKIAIDDDGLLTESELATVQGQSVRLDKDVACRSCGTNLRGELSHGVCPACGEAVVSSRSSDSLKFADIGWLTTLYRGVSMLAIGSIVLFGMRIFIRGMVSILNDTYQPSISTLAPSSLLDAWATVLIRLVQLVVIGGGYYLLGTGQPAYIDPRPALRMLVRWLVPIAILLLMIQAVAIALGGEMMVLPALGIGLISALVYITGFVALLVYIQPLARRAGDIGLAKHARAALIGLVCFAMLTICFFGLALVVAFKARAGSGGPQSGLVIALWYLSTTLTIAYFGMMVWWLMVMFMFRKILSVVLKSAHRRARAAAASLRA